LKQRKSISYKNLYCGETILLALFIIMFIIYINGIGFDYVIKFGLIQNINNIYQMYKWSRTEEALIWKTISNWPGGFWFFLVFRWS
jgi:hypothetical protein